MKTLKTQSRKDDAPPLPLLYDELWIEILSRLRVKSLLKLRCVSKSWKSLISDPDFVKLHLRRSSTNTIILRHFIEDNNLVFAHYSVRSLMEKSPPLITVDHNINATFLHSFIVGNDPHVVGSCNGLVCLSRTRYGTVFGECWFSVLNPATKLTSKEGLTYLFFNTHCNFRYAFGYDNLSDTYKVVAFCLNSIAEEESQKTHVKVCNLGDNNWRNIHSFPAVPFSSSYSSCDGVYFNGTLNWLASSNIIRVVYKWDDTTNISQMAIVSLDMGMETSTKLLLPRCLDGSLQFQPTIVVLMDCLCFSHDYKKTHFMVWQMKEFGVQKSWTQIIKVSYHDLQITSSILDYCVPLVPLCIFEKVDILIIAREQGFLYNRRDNRVKQTELHPRLWWECPEGYVESLISPYCNEGSGDWASSTMSSSSASHEHGRIKYLIFNIMSMLCNEG